MIDFHSHILPGVDDGSRDIPESISLLKMLSEQGVTTVTATPHFHASRESIDEFIKRRNTAADLLKSHMLPNSPKILCGAEVMYYSGISNMSQIDKLCIEGTNLFLLEMSVTKWTEYTMRELLELAGNSTISVIIAHMDRYMDLQSEKTLYSLYESGILMQFNADYFNRFCTRRKAINLLMSGKIHLIGSDCHNLTSRPPRIGKAFDIIRKNLGEDFVSRIHEYEHSLLLNKTLFI